MSRKDVLLRAAEIARLRAERDALRSEVDRLRLEMKGMVQAMAEHGSQLNTYAANVSAMLDRKKGRKVFATNR